MQAPPAHVTALHPRNHCQTSQRQEEKEVPCILALLGKHSPKSDVFSAFSPLPAELLDRLCTSHGPTPADLSLSSHKPSRARKQHFKQGNNKICPHFAFQHILSTRNLSVLQPPPRHRHPRQPCRIPGRFIGLWSLPEINLEPLAVAQGWMWRSGVTCGSGSRYHVPRHPPAPTPCRAEWGNVCPQRPPQGVFAKPEQGDKSPALGHLDPTGDATSSHGQEPGPGSTECGLAAAGWTDPAPEPMHSPADHAALPMSCHPL